MTGLNNPVTDEQLGCLVRKWRAIQEKLEAVVLLFEKVKGAFQAIHDEQFGDTLAPVVHQRTRKIQLVHGMFVPAETQLENVRRWDEEYEWGFGGEVFENLPDPPTWPGDQLVAVVLVPYLQNVQGTFDSLWGIAASRQKNHWRRSDLRSDADHLRLLKGIEHRPGLRWEVIDLGANWDKKDGTAPESVRSPQSSPHAGVLACADHHPKWVQAMDGVKVPYSWVPGYEAIIPGVSKWRGTPCLRFGRVDRGVFLSADGCGSRYSGYAVPSFRGGARH